MKYTCNIRYSTHILIEIYFISFKVGLYSRVMYFCILKLGGLVLYKFSFDVPNENIFPNATKQMNGGIEAYNR